METLDYSQCEESYITKLDKYAYWLFIVGIYQGDKVKALADHNHVIGLLFVGLFLERSAINWLRNRWGCDYFYF